MGVIKKRNVDPLFQLFEHYLLNRSYEDSSAFTKEVAEEYITYLDSTTAHVPFHARANLLEDLEAETHEMLVKKMYGCVRNVEHVNYGKVMKVDEDEFDTFEIVPPANNSDKPEKS